MHCPGTGRGAELLAGPFHSITELSARLLHLQMGRCPQGRGLLGVGSPGRVTFLLRLPPEHGLAQPMVRRTGGLPVPSKDLPPVLPVGLRGDSYRRLKTLPGILGDRDRGGAGWAHLS